MNSNITNDNLVSIIMPAYNSACFISDSIKSVINQTYSNWELLVIDDCSHDNTIEVVKSFNDERVVLIESEKNGGGAIARNKGLAKAKGKWIAFLDSDDIWYNTKLEKQLNFMITNNYNFSYTDYEKIDEDGKEMNILCTGPKVVNRFKMYNFDYLGCLTVMYNREVVGDLQIKNVGRNDDYAMWLKVIKYSNCYLLDEILAKYRVRKNSVSHESLIENIKSHYYLYRIGDNKNKVVALVLTIRNLFFGVLKKIIYQKSIK